MEAPRELLSLVSLYEQLGIELELGPASFQAPPPRRRPTVRLLDGRRFRGIYFNGTMDGESPSFCITINPRLSRLYLSLTSWREIQADRVPTLDRDMQNLYPRPGRERECLVCLFHPGMAA